MEDRTLLASFVVSSTNDGGPGSLRQAILDSNSATGGTNTIDFAIPGRGVQTIAPLSELPAITQSVLIDGFSEPGYAGTPLIELSGSQAGTSDGLTITGPDVTVRGLNINGFSQGAGIHVTGTGATGNWIYGNFLGTDPTGTQALPNNEGVEIDAGATRNLVGTNGDGVNDASERNLLSGNLFAGVWITGQGTSSNAVAGNWIGTDISGSVALKNGTQPQPVTDSLGAVFGDGVLLAEGASSNWIGVNPSGGQAIQDEGNVISGNLNDGVQIWSSASFNVVAGNKIGTDVSGTAALGNSSSGVEVDAGCIGNTIGGTASGAGNVISANGNYGIWITGAGTTGVVVQHNLIGTDITGTAALGNWYSGVQIDSGAANNTIGGTIPADSNVISANHNYGVHITGAGTTGNLVQGNTIGTDITGTVALGNVQGGGAVDNGAVNNTVGGLTTSGDVFHGFDFTSATSPAALSFQADLSGPSEGQTSGGPTAVYRIDVEANGQLLAIVHAQGFTARLMLLDSQGRVLVQSDGLSPTDPDSVIDQHLTSGSYSLVVESTGGAGIYTLTTTLTQATVPFQPLPVGYDPDAIVAGDFTGNGRTDLAVADGNGIEMLLGNGDGTFQPANTIAGVSGPVVAGDFTGNGRLDLAVVNSGIYPNGGTVSVLLGNGDGTFQPQVTYAVGLFPDAIVTGDFTGDGRTDLAVVNSGIYPNGGTVSVLLGNGDGTFQPQVTYAVGTHPDAIVAGDFTGNGRLDLAVANFLDKTVSVLLGNGDGTFQPQVTYAVGTHPDAIVAGDFTGNGRTDLAVANELDNTVSVLLGNGDGTFSNPGQFATTPHATPLVADVNGDGTNDVLVVDGAGNILYRQAIPGQPGTFEPPVTVNPGNPSRDIAWVPNTSQGPVLASVDAHDNAISLYAYRDGGFVKVGSLATGLLPAQIIAADLNGDGLTDLVVRNAGDGTLSVFFGTEFDRSTFLGPVDTQFVPPQFLPPVTIPVGLGVSDVQAVDTTGSGRLDLVVTNKLSAQVSVLHNLGDGSFAAPRPLPCRDRVVGDRSRQHARGHESGGDGGRRRRTAHARRSDQPGDDQPRLEHARRARRPWRRPLRQSRHHSDREPRPGRPHGRLHRQRNRRPGRSHHEWREHLSRQRQGWLPVVAHLPGRPRVRRVDPRRSDGKRQTRPLGRRCLWRCPGAAGQRRWNLPALPRG